MKGSASPPRAHRPRTTTPSPPDPAPPKPRWWEAPGNAVADNLAAAVGTIVRELYLIGAQVINLIALVLLHLLDPPSAPPSNGPGPNLARLPVESDTEEEPDDVRIFRRSMTTGKGRSVLRILLRLGWDLPGLFAAPQPFPNDSRVAYMTARDKVTTGCFEDIYAANLAFIDHWRVGMRKYLFRLRFPSYFRHMRKGLDLLSPSRIFRADLLDTRTPRDFIVGQGYPYAGARVRTADGYELQVDRIPRPAALTAIYFQHGILDSSYGWVCCGSVQSAAFLAHDRGHDVFFGNLRGNGQSYNPPDGMPYNRYWDFTLDHHGAFDVAAVVEYITRTKQEELGPDSPFTITIVAHSLGAAAALVYLVREGLRGRTHRVTKAVLMSPAGYHTQCPLVCRLLGWPLYGIERFVKLTGLGPLGLKVTSLWVKVFLAKLFRDIHGHPALRTLCCAALSQYLIGGYTSDFPLQHVHSLFFNVLQGGVTINLMEQFWLIYTRDRFESFDYGATGNTKHYGQPQPIDYMAHYDKVRCEVHFVAGLRDWLIPPINVLKHYDTMKLHQKSTVFKAVDAGHADLTIAICEEALAYIMDVVGVGTDAGPAPQTSDGGS